MIDHIAGRVRRTGYRWLGLVDDALNAVRQQIEFVNRDEMEAAWAEIGGNCGLHASRRSPDGE
jgi:hypothetical protein